MAASVSHVAKVAQFKTAIDDTRLIVRAASLLPAVIEGPSPVKPPPQAEGSPHERLAYVRCKLKGSHDYGLWLYDARSLG